jgi:hypothetical protein
MRPTAGVIDQNHSGNRHPAKHIQRQQTVFGRNGHLFFPLKEKAARKTAETQRIRKGFSLRLSVFA